MSNVIHMYADTLSVNEEDVRAVVTATADALYDGDIERCLDDLEAGVLRTEDGLVTANSYLDEVCEDLL